MRVAAVAGIGAYAASAAIDAAAARLLEALGAREATLAGALVFAMLAGAIVAAAGVRREPVPVRSAAVAVGFALACAVPVAAAAVLAGAAGSLPFQAVPLAGTWGLSAVPVAYMARRMPAEPEPVPDG